MPILKVATDEEIATIHRESHALWGAGLSVAAYNDLWMELRMEPWARGFFAHYVWIDGPEGILSSAKVYRPLLRVRDGVERVAAVGAVFTPRGQRGRGHASAMLRSIVSEARDRADRAALLFSDIGTEYYAGLGFLTLPAEEASGSLRWARRSKPSDCSLRPMVSADLDAVVDAHRASNSGRPIAMIRDRQHWEFLMARARSFFSRLDRSDISRRYRVALRDGRLVGYVVSAEGDGEWNLREVGAIDGDLEVMSAILRLAASDARESGMIAVYGWLTRELAELVPEWRLRFEARSRAIPMILPLRDADELHQAPCRSSFFLPYLDQF